MRLPLLDADERVAYDRQATVTQLQWVERFLKMDYGSDIQ